MGHIVQSITTHKQSVVEPVVEPALCLPPLFTILVESFLMPSCHHKTQEKKIKVTMTASVLDQIYRPSQEEKDSHYKPGSIKRVKLTNFLTYDAVEFFPGPR